MIIVLVIIVINLQNKFIKPNHEKSQTILNNENITSKLKDEIIIENEKVYMSFDDIKNFLDSTIYKEETTNSIVTTSNKKISVLKKDEENIQINGSKQKAKNILIEKDEKTYIAISELENVYDYKFEYIKNSNTITIDSLSKECIKAYANKNIKIKEQNKKFSKIVGKVSKGNWLIYINEENGVAKVRTQDGTIGYVKKVELDNFVTERENFIEKEKNITTEKPVEYDITGKDITTLEKRIDIIKLILQETIKNDNMYVKIIYNGEDNFEFERFKIEITPMLHECGIKIDI